MVRHTFCVKTQPQFMHFFKKKVFLNNKLSFVLLTQLVTPLLSVYLTITTACQHNTK